MRWIPGGRRYRRDERVSWRIQSGMECSRCTLLPTIHEAAAAVQTSFQKYVRGSLAVSGFPQWNTGGRKHRHVMLYVFAILFYLCLNILKHSLCPPSLATLSSCVSHRPLTVSSNVRLSFWPYQNARNCQCTYVQSFCGSSQETTERQNQSCSLERNIIFQEMQGNIRNIALYYSRIII